MQRIYPVSATSLVKSVKSHFAILA